MITYNVVEKQMTAESKKRYIAYGISVSCGDEVVEVINDISINREDVVGLCRCCNTLKLDPAHLKNVVEDFII